MENEDKSLAFSEELRGRRRDATMENSEFNRLKAFDSHRFVESEIVTEKDIAGLCSRIKRRKHASAQDLQRLGNAFIQSQSNISAFLKSGSLNVIVKELTGNDRIQQIIAAQCLANLSLGDEACCAKIATFAGSYLMIFLMKTSDSTLARLCFWITQNISAAGEKALDILLSQELLKNTLHILTESVELSNEALQLLDIIVEKKWSEIGDEKEAVRKQIWENFKKRSDGLSLQLFFRVFDSESLKNFTESDIKNLLQLLTRNLHTASDEISMQLTVKVLFELFAVQPESTEEFLAMLSESKTKLTEVINRAALNPKLFPVITDLLAFYAMLPDAHALDSPENLRIPKIFEF